MSEHLELELRALEVEWPETPRFSVDFGAAPVRRPPLRWRPAPALAAALALLIGVGAAVEPVRAKIEDLIGIAGNERVVRVPHVPPAPALDLGRPVTLARARRQAPFRLLLAHTSAHLTGVRIGGDNARGSVSLIYGPDTVLTETPDESVYPGVKQVANGIAVRFPQIGNDEGIWVAAGPRVIRLQGFDGVVRARRAALPGAGVLIWQRGRVALRLETRQGYDSAVRLARSVR